MQRFAGVGNSVRGETTAIVTLRVGRRSPSAAQGHTAAPHAQKHTGHSDTRQLTAQTSHPVQTTQHVAQLHAHTHPKPHHRRGLPPQWRRDHTIPPSSSPHVARPLLLGCSWRAGAVRTEFGFQQQVQLPLKCLHGREWRTTVSRAGKRWSRS